MIRGLGGREQVEKWLPAEISGECAVHTDTITEDSLVGLLYNSPEFENEVVCNFSEERAFIPEAAPYFDHSLEIYELVRGRLEKEDALYKMMTVL